MSKFSEYLERGIISSGMTEKQLAKISGFTRSYIALMRNGQRVSPDTEKMIRLIQALNLPVHEYDELWSHYIRARVGDEIYDRDKAVLELFQSFNNDSNLIIPSFSQYEIPEVKTISNKMNLEQIIRAVILNESMKEDGFLHIIMQGENNILSQILPAVCKNNKELKIEHIVCMEHGKNVQEGKAIQLHNVKILKELIPVTIYSNSANYNIYCYYEREASRFHSGTLFCYMILSSEYLICMNAELSKGILFKEKEIRDIYENLFCEQKRKCRPMFLYMKDEIEMLSYHANRADLDDVTYSVAQQPCFGVLKVDNLVKKYCNPGNAKMIPVLEGMIRKNQRWLQKENGKHISFCCKEGLERFVKEGVIDELPQEIYHSLKVEDRKLMLKMLLDAIENGKYELYLLDTEQLIIPKELFVTVYSIFDAALVYLSEYESARFILSERSLTMILYESLHNLSKNLQIGQTQNAKEYIQQILTTM